MRYTFLTSVATLSLGGAALLMPSAAFATQTETAPEGSDAVMGPVEEYQYGLTVNGVSPTLRSVVVDGESILAYCIEYWVRAADPDHTSAVTGWDEFTGDNNFKTDPQVREHVAWILRNSHPTLSLADLAERSGATDLTEGEAVAATQAAIWHYTDDFVADGELTVESSAQSNQPVTERSAHNVQVVFDYFTGSANTGLSEQEVQASVTLVDASESEPTVPEVLEHMSSDEGDQLLGPIELNASTDQVDLEITSVNEAVDITDLAVLDVTGQEIDTRQPVDAAELWVHVPAETPAGGVHIAAESTEFGYTGRLITPEPDAQRRFQTIVLVDETSHQADTELELHWQAAPVEPPQGPETPPAPPEPPVEEPPVEVPPVEEPPTEAPSVPPTSSEEPVSTPEPDPEPEPETSVVPEPSPSQPDPIEQKTQDVEEHSVEAAGELAETGAHQTRNVLVALGILAVGAALLVINRVVRKKASNR